MDKLNLVKLGNGCLVGFRLEPILTHSVLKQDDVIDGWPGWGKRRLDWNPLFLIKNNLFSLLSSRPGRPPKRGIPFPPMSPQVIHLLPNKLGSFLRVKKLNCDITVFFIMFHKRFGNSKKMSVKRISLLSNFAEVNDYFLSLIWFLWKEKWVY